MRISDWSSDVCSSDLHTRDELGILEMTTARPIQAAFTSAVTFTCGAALPLLIVFVAPMRLLVPIEAGASLLFLALLGAVGAMAGGASVWRASARVTFWGALAMAATAGIGPFVGAALCNYGEHERTLCIGAGRFCVDTRK